MLDVLFIMAVIGALVALTGRRRRRAEFKALIDEAGPQPEPGDAEREILERELSALDPDEPDEDPFGLAPDPEEAGRVSVAKHSGALSDPD